MTNTNDCNKNKDDVSSPEQTKIVVKAKNKSKHRIMYFELTIRLIREMFCLQMNTIVSKLKNVLVAVSKKSSTIKTPQFQNKKSGSFLKKKTKLKKNVLLLEAILFFFSQMHFVHLMFQKSGIPVTRLNIIIRNIRYQGTLPTLYQKESIHIFLQVNSSDA
jgi:hypothetical protein